MVTNDTKSTRMFFLSHSSLGTLWHNDDKCGGENRMYCTLPFFLLREIDRKIGRPRRRWPDFSTARMRRRNGEKSFASICPRGEKVLLLADEQVICKAKKGNLTGIENVLQKMLTHLYDQQKPLLFRQL